MADIEAVISNAVEDAADIPVGGDDAATDTDTGGEETDGEGSVSDDGEGTGEGGDTGTQSAEADGDGEGDEKSIPDPVDKELGPKTRKDGKENRIPYSNVKKIAGNAQVRGQGEVLAKVAEAMGVDVSTLTLDSIGTALKGHTMAPTEVQAELTQHKQVADFMERDPDAFIKAAAAANPGYQKFLTAIGDEAKVDTPTKEFKLDLPQPDVDLGNGSKTYSAEGLQQLVSKVAEQSIVEGERRAGEKITAEVTPFRDQQQSVQRFRQMQQVAQTQYQDAQQWEGFADSEADILAALTADNDQAKATNTRPKLTLDAAYRQIVLPKLKADKAAIRKEVLAEMKKKATSTSTTSGPDAGAADDSDVADEDPVMAAIRKSMHGKK